MGERRSLSERIGEWLVGLAAPSTERWWIIGDLREEIRQHDKNIEKVTEKTDKVVGKKNAEGAKGGN